MDILQLIDRLEELFNDAKAVPFTHNVIVDEDRMLELIDQMRTVWSSPAVTIDCSSGENRALQTGP